MSKPIRILIVEDLASDFELAQLEIRKSVEDCVFKQVDTRPGFLEALEIFQPDVILSDYSLPRFDGMTALKLAKVQAPLTPFIIWTGSMSEDIAVECMKAGANNYILKENLKRLGPAIMHSIEERHILVERQRANEALQESEARYHGIFESAQDAIFLESLEGNILDVNQRACQIYGYTREEFLTKKVSDLVPSEEYIIWFNKEFDIHGKTLETMNVRSNGERFPVEISGGTYEFNGLKLFLIVLRDITERKLAEEKYQDIFEQSQEGIFQSTPEGRFIKVNPAMASIYGYDSSEDMIQSITSISSQIYVDPKDRDEFILALYAKDRLERFEMRNLRKDGSILWTSTSARAVRDTDGNILYYEGFLQDITERKLAEIEIQQRNDDLRLINAINEAALHDVRLEGIVNLLAREFKYIFSSTGSTLYLLAADGKSLNMQQYLLPPEIQRQVERLIGSTIPLIQIPIQEGGFLNRVLNSQHGFVTSDREEIQQWMMEFLETPFLPKAAKGVIRKLIPQIFDVLNIRSVIAIPLLLNGKAIGILDVSSPALFTENDLHRIENISGQLTAALQRQKANEQLRRSEEFLQSVQNALSASIAILDENGVIVQVNSAWRKFGEQNDLRHPEYCIGSNYLDICDMATGPNSEEAYLVAQAIREVITGQRREVQVEYPCHSPEEKRWFTLRITKFDDGDHIWVVLAHENITGRKQAENAFKETNEQFHTLFEASPEGIILIEPQGDWRILDCNEAACAMNGYTRDELVGQSIDLLLLTSGDPVGRLEYLASVREAGILRYDDYHRRKDGTVFPITVSTSLIILGGHEVILGIDHDITERKRAEDALRESEAIYRQAIEVAGAVPYYESYYDNGLAIKYDFIGDGIRQITGYGPEEFNAKLWDSLVEEVVLVEGLEGYSLEEGIQRVRSGENPIWKCEHRIRDREGKTHWVFEAAIEIRDEHGISHGSIGTYQDITARKQAEQALLESEQRYRALFEDMPIAVWEDDLSEVKKYLDALKEQGVTNFHEYFESHPEELPITRQLVKILDVNKAALEMYGAVSKQELIDITVEEMGPGELEHWVDDLTAIATGKSSFSWEGGDLKMDDTPIEISLSWTVVPGYEHNYSRVIFTTIDITERKQMEAKLQASETRYRLATLATKDVIWEWNPKKNQLIWTENAQTAFGYSPEEVGPEENWWDEHLHPEDRQRVLSAVNSAMVGTDTFWSEEYRFQLKDGSYAYVNDHGYIDRDADGKVTRLIGAMSNITERKRAETAEREQRALAEAMRDTAETLNSTLDYGEVLDHILTAAGRVVLHDAASILLIDSGIARAARERGYGERGFRAEVMEMELSLTDTANLRQMNETGQPVVISETSTYPGWKVAPHTEWLHSNVGAPISIHGERVGFILLDSETPGFFTTVHAERLKAFANQAAIAIQNSRLLKQAQEEILERKRAEEELRQSESRYRTVVENQTEFIVRWTPNGGRTFVNDAYCHYFGITREQALTTNFIPLVYEEDQPAVEKKISRLLSGSIQMETDIHRVIKPDGSIGWQEWTDQAIYGDNGQLIEFQSVGRDITERKQAEKELREEQEKVQKYLDIAAVMMLALDRAGNVSLINQKGCEILGYSNDEIIEKNWINSFVPASMRDEMQDIFQKLMQEDGESLLYYENPVLTKNGEERIIAWHNTLVRDENGRIITSLSSGEDITERRRAEEALRESEEKYRLLFDSNPLPMWIYDLETLRFLKVNNAAINHYGYSETEFMAMTIKDIRPPADIPRLIEIISQITDGMNRAGIWSHIKKDGSVIHVEIISHVVEFESHRAELVLANDVTERLLAERELRASEERFRQLANNIQEVFWMTDAVTGEEIYISPAAEKIWGYSLEDLMTNSNAFIESIYPEDLPAVQQMLAIQRAGQPTSVEYRTLRLDGSICWVWDRAFPIFDETGKVVRLAGIAADITERKRTDAETQRHLAELEALYENGLAVGRLLNPIEIGERIIDTFARYLSWHHVAIRLLQPESNTLELIAYNLPVLSNNEKTDAEKRLRSMISKVGQGLSGWVVQTGEPFRTGNVHAHSRYVDTQAGIQSGLYMPLKIGDRIIGVISVESKEPDAFTSQDERLLATLASQAAIAFENARLYQTNQQERDRFSELFENTPVATWLEDFSAVIAWMNGLRNQGITNLKEYLEKNPEAYKVGISLIDILDMNHTAVVMNGARDKSELLEKVHGLLMDETPSQVMIHELELIWRGYTSFGFEMSSQKLDGSIITGIQRIYIPITNNEPDYRRVIVTSTDITERVRFEQQLRTSEIHYRELADSITDVFFELDQNLHFSHWNKASETLLGVATKDAIGKPMREVFVESDQQDLIEEVHNFVTTHHKPQSFETNLKINGTKHTFEINAYPSTRGVAVVAKDVTERKLSESLMQKRFELMEYSAQHDLEELMQKALDEVSEWTYSSIGFFQIIKEDQITPSLQVWSTDAFQHFHTSEAEKMHKPADQAGVWAEAIRLRRAVIQNDYTSMTGKKGLPESHATLLRELVVPIIRNERIVAVIGIGNKSQEYTRDDLEITERFADYAWDVIERKQIVTELAEERNQLARRVEERTADLSRANSNLARALRVKDEFLASMSHELRTPLNAILGLSESLSEQVAGPLNEKQQKYLTTISESGHHLLSLINDILDLAKIEAGQITLDINKVDVNLVCQASLRMIKQLAQKKNLDVAVGIDQKIGLMWADERRLKQMMVNLLSNAVKFTPEGGKLGLQIQGDQEDNKVMITVWDTGIGIREADFQRLFQPFVQLDSGLAREATGTGLGLALVAQMARLHGGSVNVTSEPGQGSRFTIVLPWQPAQAMTIAEKLKVTGKFRAIKDRQGPQTILLVEDTQEVVMMIKDYLEIAGYKVVIAQDGLDGITQAKLSHPDLILMDVQMPRMDGLEATQKLRQDPEFKQTPIIALTALAMPNDRERCLAAGMDEYISKPVNLRALVKIIQSCLSIREEKTIPP